METLCGQMRAVQVSPTVAATTTTTTTAEEEQASSAGEGGGGSDAGGLSPDPPLTTPVAGERGDAGGLSPGPPLTTLSMGEGVRDAGGLSPDRTSMTLLTEDKGDASGLSPDTISTATPSAVALLPREHLKLEVQVHSQFQLLWAVFQSHSTAEDEVIWPALKEKARSSGGKVRHHCSLL